MNQKSKIMADTPIVPDTNWEYHNPTGEEFPIMASDPGPYNKKTVNGAAKADVVPVQTEEFNILRQCGFNLVRLGSQYWDIGVSNTNALGTGVGITPDPEDKILLNPEECKKFICKYKDLTNVVMFDFGDEKTMSQMEDISVPYNYARQVGISQLPIFNNGGDAGQPDNLNKLQQWFHPAVWCYDHYPVLQEWRIRRICDEDGKCTFQKVGSTGVEPPRVSSNMFLLLERYRNMASKTRRPFWYYVQCMSYCDLRKKDWSDSTDQCTMRPVSEEYMRFSAFSALAYGAKGLRYWAYSLRKPSKDSEGKYTEAYFEAPIDLNNVKTDVYDWVRAVNREVQAFSRIFLHSEVSDVYHVWHAPDFQYAHMAGAKTLPATGAGPISGMSCDGDGVTVSLFTSKGKHYVMLVSHDINKNQKVEIRWRPGYDPVEVSEQYGVNGHFSLLRSSMEAMADTPLLQRVDTIKLDKCGYYIASYDPNMAYINPTGNEFPILASSPCQEWIRTLTGSMFQGLKDCGFNMVDVNSNIWNVQTAADLARANGMRLAVSSFDWRNPDSCTGKIDDYGDIGNVAAWNLYSDLAADPLADHIRAFADTYDAARAQDTGRLLLWNMIPSSVSSDPVTKLTEMQTLLKPGMWCAYTNASCTQRCDASGNIMPGSEPETLSSFYDNLETFAAISRATDRPFWHYANCMSHHTAGYTFLVPVSETIMRHSVFTALAYGAKGLRWWQYAVRKPSGGVTYSEAPIGEDGGKTAIWCMVKRINTEVSAYGKMFLNAHDNAVFHTGETIPAGTTRLPAAHGPLLNLVSGKAGVTVSFFSSDDREHVMIVNHDLVNPQEVTVSWRPGIYPSEAADGPKVAKSYTVISSDDEWDEESPLMQRTDTVRLDAGGYFIASWTPNMKYVNPTGIEFPICSIYPRLDPPKKELEDGTVIEENRFDRMRKCLFNMVVINSGIWKDVPAAIGQTAGLNLHIAVSGFDWRNPGSCIEKIEELKDIGKITAWNLYSDLASDPLFNNLDAFARTYNAVRATDTGNRLLLWNMIPSTIAGDPAGRLTEIQRLLAPGMWCAYTTASCTQACDEEGNPLLGSKPRLISTFYSNLETLMALAKTTGRPFWHYANCMSYHYAGSSFMIPVTWEIMRHSAFSALAYGAKGIRWWEYELRKSTEGARYFTAPIGLEGQKDDIWNGLRTVNKEIANLGSIFLYSTDHEVYHTGDTIPDGTRRAPTKVGPFLYLKAYGDGVLLSLFTSMGRRYAMFVSHNVSSSQNFEIGYDPEKIELIAVPGTHVRPVTEQVRQLRESPLPDDFLKPDIIPIYKYSLYAGWYAIFEYKIKT